jgi:uncharacterized protein YndB with AHSA1/START domain
MMSNDLTLLIEREFDAPPERIFDAWTNPDSPVGWWGPKGFSHAANESDARAGGHWRMSMRGPEGRVHSSSGVYLEFEPPTRLVMTHGWDSDEPRHETQISVTLIDLGGRTLMRFEQTGFASPTARDGHRGGWNSAFGGLEEALRRMPAQ